MIHQSLIFDGGADEDRTRDLLHAMEALSQLSYSPNDFRLFVSSENYLIISPSSSQGFSMVFYVLGQKPAAMLLR